MTHGIINMAFSGKSTIDHLDLFIGERFREILTPQ